MAPNTLDPVTKKSERIEEESSIARPRSGKESGNKSDSADLSHSEVRQKTNETVFKPQIRWPDLIAQVFIHVGSIYGLYYLITLRAKFYTYIWCKFVEGKLAFVTLNQFSFLPVVILVYASGIGITAGQR